MVEEELGEPQVLRLVGNAIEPNQANLNFLMARHIDHLALFRAEQLADVAALTGEKSYINAIDGLWDNVVGKKMYLTGGIGARHANEVPRSLC